MRMFENISSVFEAYAEFRRFGNKKQKRDLNGPVINTN